MAYNKYRISSPCGTIEIELENDQVIQVQFVDTKHEVPNGDSIPPLVKEITEYFNGIRREFSTPIKFEGTRFQIKVWRALQAIPFGETRTYKEIAEAIGSPGAVRAVGTACGKNRHLLLVPCHRVVAASGLGGFAAGIERKKWLLHFEQEGVKQQ